MTTVWLRADGGPSVGLGHVARCIALGEAAWRAGHDVRFVTATLDATGELLDRYGLRIVGLKDEADTRWLEEVGPRDAIVLDGYGFDHDDQAAARATGARTALLTDVTSGRFVTDVVVNPSTTAVDYELGNGTQLLSGPAYALVRDEFRTFRRERDELFDTLLITLGGGDANELATAMVERLAGMCRLIVIQGPAAPPLRLDAPDVVVVHDPPSVAAVADKAQAAISAAGGTTWEMLCLGMPTALVEVADNQAVVAATAAEAGAVLRLGGPDEALEGLQEAVFSLVSPAERRRLWTAGLALVDGDGADRVVAALLG